MPIEFLDVPPLQTVSGTVRLPGSKSISNRALLLAALCPAQTTLLDGVLDSDDTQVMQEALAQLGGGVERVSEDCVRVVGLPPPSTQEEGIQSLFLGNAGTAMRPLVAALALRGGSYRLHGTARMHERPIGDLVDALLPLGCQIRYEATPGFPPLRIDSPALHLRAPIEVRGDVSSQFLTGLLMALPQVTAQHDVRVNVIGELISKPYIEITLTMLARFGIHVQRDGWKSFTIPAGSKYQSPGQLHVEADASSATYFIAAGAMNASLESRSKEIGATREPMLRIDGVGAGAVQGDIAFADAAAAMGVNVTLLDNSIEVRRGAWPLEAIDLDCNHIPDAAMTLAVMALFGDGPSTLRNIASWRVKETDRIAAMATELRKVGATVEEGADWLRVHPLRLSDFRPASIETYDDHRMAMCLSLAAFNGRVPVRILDPGCVAKTFPNYFNALFRIAEAETPDIPVICIDGPAASGKGTLASIVASRLGYHYLDSGMLYRATAVAAARAGVSLEDAVSCAAIAAGLDLRFEGVGDDQTVWLGSGGEAFDATVSIRSAQAGTDASVVSVHPAVRAALSEVQWRFRRLPGLVADGRDMGTVIFPAAKLKVYLTATAQARAERRCKQLISKGFSASIDVLRSELEARDARDSSRSVAPLKPAEDAVHLDNSELNIEQSVRTVLDWWNAKQPF